MSRKGLEVKLSRGFAERYYDTSLDFANQRAEPVAGLGLGGAFLLDPAIHRVGLLLATIVAGVAIGLGAIQHRRAAPFVVAMTGLSFMGGALAVEHGPEEAVLTIIGVSLVALGHVLNLRRR